MRGRMELDIALTDMTAPEVDTQDLISKLVGHELNVIIVPTCIEAASSDNQPVETVALATTVLNEIRDKTHNSQGGFIMLASLGEIFSVRPVTNGCDTVPYEHITLARTPGRRPTPRVPLALLQAPTRLGDVNPLHHPFEG